MDQPYFPNLPFRTPLTPVPSAPASPYDHHSLDGFTTSSFEEFPDDLAVFQMYKVEPEACIYESPYLPISVQTPALASFCPRISMDAPIETQMEGLQQRDRRQSPPESPSLSGGPSVATEEISRRRRERRRAQNRAAQRAFRLRKEDTIKVISAKLSKMVQEMEWMKLSNQDLSNQVSALQQNIQILEKENRELKEASLSESPYGSTPIGRTFLIPETYYLEGA